MNVESNHNRCAAESSHRQHLSETYSLRGYGAFKSTMPDPVSSSRPALFATNHDHTPSNLHSRYDDMFGPMDNLIIPAGITPLVDNTSIEHEHLRQEVELLIMEAEEHNELVLDDEDDATITNITEQLQSVPSCVSSVESSMLNLTCI